MTMILDSAMILESVARQEQNANSMDQIIVKKRPSASSAPRRQRLEKSTSRRGLGLEKSNSRRSLSIEHHQQASSPPSTRGLHAARNAAARFQASKLAYETPIIAAHAPPTRGVRRTTSMDNNNELPRARMPPLRRNKSSDAMPRRNVAAMERSTSVRRVNSSSNRRGVLSDRSNSERRFESEAQIQQPLRPPTRLDNSSSVGASDRRRRLPMDESSNRSSGGGGGGPRRLLPGRTLSSSSGCSASGCSASVRRRRRSKRENSMRNVPDFERLDASGASQEEEEEEVEEDMEPSFVVRGKGLDDSNRRRKEPTLSRLSINELRNRLVGKDEKEQGDDTMEGSGNNFEVKWDNDVPPPLSSDLNDDGYY